MKYFDCNINIDYVPEYVLKINTKTGEMHVNKTKAKPLKKNQHKNN